MTIALPDLDRDSSIVQELRPDGGRSAYPRRSGLKQRLTRGFRRFETLTRDRIRYSGATRRIFNIGVSQGERLRHPRDSDEIARSVSRLARAGRVDVACGHSSRINFRIQRLMQDWSPDGFHWSHFFPRNDSRLISNALILKRPASDGEKGVLFVAFEFEWMRIFQHAKIELLARDYDLVFSPSWSPPQDLALLIANRVWPSELFSILSNFDDLDTFRSVYPKVHPIPLLASSWVDPNGTCSDEEQPKRFDIVMLANFGNYKRHYALFRALSQMRASVRVLLLGIPWAGRSRAVLEREAEVFGVSDNIVIQQGLYGSEMFRELRSAKISVVTSLVEGSCVAVAESLFAGVPVGLLRNARIGSKAFINERTGRLLSEGSLASDLTSFLEHYSEYRPREWALEAGIGCRESSGVLNDHLKRAAISRGRQWTVDIAPMHWRPYPRYLCDADRSSLQDEYDRFASTYGVGIKVPT